MVDFQALARQYVAEESEQVRDQLALSASSGMVSLICKLQRPLCASGRALNQHCSHF